MTKEELISRLSESQDILESDDYKTWSYVGIAISEAKKYIEKTEAAQPKWISVDDEMPTKEQAGMEFLVLIEMKNSFEFQIAEWFDAEDGETELEFNIEEGWCGQQMINKKVTHWMPIPKPPSHD